MSNDSPLPPPPPAPPNPPPLPPGQQGALSVLVSKATATAHATAQATAQALSRGGAMSEEQRLVLAVFGVAGVALLVCEVFMGGEWLPGRFGMFLIVYALVVVAGSLPADWISTRLDEVLDRWVRDKTGSGFYGMVALGTFAHSELHDLIDPDDGLLSGWNFVQGSVVQHVIGFSVDSMKNFITAFIWPFQMMSDHGALQTVVFALGCWAVFLVGRSFLPLPSMVKSEERADPAAPKRKKRSRFRRWFG